MADQMTDRPTDARARLLEHFAEGTLDQGERWAKLWDKGDFLPWDRGLPNPALVDLLADREDLIGSSIEDNEQPSRRRKKVLVPGCGKGYDVLLFASFGYDAYGLEISESAVKACRKEQETNGHKYPIRNPSIGGGRADFLKGDFFGHDWIDAIQGEAVFDIIYDYTVAASSPRLLATMPSASLTDRRLSFSQHYPRHCDLLGRSGCLVCCVLRHMANWCVSNFPPTRTL